MRTSFFLCFIANLVLLVVSYVILPENVAIHFGVDGTPDRWAPTYVNALLMAATHCVIFAVLIFSTKATRLFPKKYINIPNKHYWLQDGNWRTVESILSQEMYLFGSVLFAFMFFVGLLALQANLSTPVRLRMDLFWWPFGALMCFMVYWTIRLVKRFKVPDSK